MSTPAAPLIHCQRKGGGLVAVVRELVALAVGLDTLACSTWGSSPSPQGSGVLRHSPMESRTPNPEPSGRC